jgi:lysophospholipase L1-like esterase
VALGDSYTIGTSVEAGRGWPDQLVAALAGPPPALELVANLGVNGYTSDDLIRDQLPALVTLAPEFASVLIGVNDVVQGVPADTYAANVDRILDAVLTHMAPDRVVTVAIPDYTVTSSGADYGDPRRRHDGIVANNSIMARASVERGIRFVDIFDLSRQAAHDRSLVAGDGLHPSARQYSLWVGRIAPIVAELLDAPSVVR